MKEGNIQKIPVHLITGFLGSGKTTFLNHFIKERLPERILVIENECGATNIDGGLILDGVEEVLELSAGCLCCSLSDGLLDLLEFATEKRSTYDRLVIETTGIADPSSIVQVFLTNPYVAKVFELEQVICLADAGLLTEWLDEAEEALRQISFADVVLLNKVDSVAAEEVSKVASIIENINPHAHVLTGANGEFSIEDIMKVGSLRAESIEEKFNQTAPDLESHHHIHNEINNSHKISTFTLTFDQPFNLEGLSRELNRLVNLYQSQVYRVKGIVALPGYKNRVILQSVKTSFVASDGSVWKEGEARESKIVFIGRGLKKEGFQNLLSQHIVAKKNFSV
ncbi:MAG: GTP-binding protein [Bacteroidota bacterium]